MLSMARVLKPSKKSGVTSTHLKSALLSHYRFDEHFVVATEVDYGKIGGIADIMVDTGSLIYEVEIKISKQDLLSHELKKEKHTYMQDPFTHMNYLPNKFYLCVPHSMLEEASAFIYDVNPTYGLLEYIEGAEYLAVRDRVKLVKQAGILHPQYNVGIHNDILQRLSSELCSLYEKKVLDL